MGLFTKKAEDVNWVECEKRHGFDLNKNLTGCPLCVLSKSSTNSDSKTSVTLLSTSQKTNATETGTPNVNNETRFIGNHPWFNTLFSGKAAGRILANFPNKDVSVQDLLISCKTSFVSSGLTQYRGFPKDVTDPASLNRLAVHFIQGYSYLGLIKFKTGDESVENLPPRGWDKITVHLTKAGAEFIALPNNILDENKPVQKLTEKESAWFINYLKQVDKKGFGEYRVLKDFSVFLKKKSIRNEDLRNWFLNYAPFKEYLSANQKVKSSQNLAATLAGSKLALLRELGVVTDERNNYSVLREL